MLSTGIRTQVGVKIFGSDINELEKQSREIASVLKTVPGGTDVYPEQITGAPYIDIQINRERAARYGISVGAIQEVVDKGIGETNLTVTIEGRKRFPVRVRYAPEFRTTPQALGQLIVSSPDGAQIPLSQLADIRTLGGPTMISSENGLLRGTVTLNVRGRDVGGFVEEAKQVLDERVKLPAGYYSAIAACAAHGAGCHLRDALFHLSLFHRSRARIACGSVCADRRDLSALRARLQLLGRGLGRIHRLVRHSGADGCGDGDLFE
jgi:Cu(I)/Ag(I) efflux system membrane protein CusA/SilA